MAWFRNYYRCDRCGYMWEDEWSCTCDDDCPQCGLRHMSPCDSDDLTEIILNDGQVFVVLRSPERAGYYPEYEEFASFATRPEAEAFLARQ